MQDHDHQFDEQDYISPLISVPIFIGIVAALGAFCYFMIANEFGL